MQFHHFYIIKLLLDAIFIIFICIVSKAGFAWQDREACKGSKAGFAW